VPHIRKLKSDKRVAAAIQQVGFKRVKRHGIPRSAADTDAWANLRLALDEDMDRERLASDFHVVHDENYYTGCNTRPNRTGPKSEGTILSRSKTSSTSRHRQSRLIRFSNTNGT
jgi:hypothetical protein